MTQLVFESYIIFIIDTTEMSESQMLSVEWVPFSVPNRNIYKILIFF